MLRKFLKFALKELEGTKIVLSKVNEELMTNSLESLTDMSVVDIIYGTYGIIFVLSSVQGNTHPRKLAVKTIDPEQYGTKEISYLQREFSKWKRLPAHRNMVSAFDHFKITGVHRGRNVHLPAIKMPYLDLTLETCIKEKILKSETEKKIILAYAINGLRHLYRHGIEGHGDLKPSNILIQDLSRIYNLTKDGIPSTLYPYIAKVADFGWADAWKDLGLINKAWRRYIAPERIAKADNKFVRIKSDMFSIGIIAAELFQERHPASKNASRDDNTWIKFANNKLWDLSGIDNKVIEKYIRQCLDPEPDNRPSPEEGLEILSKGITNETGIKFATLLKAFDQESENSSTEELKAYRIAKIEGLGDVEETKARYELQAQLELIGELSEMNFLEWVSTRLALAQLKSGSEVIKNDFIRGLKFAANTQSIELNSFNFPIGTDSDYLNDFERFCDLIHPIISFLEVKESEIRNYLISCSNLFAAAFISYFAINCKTASKYQEAVDFFTQAISYYPEESRLYYFRALSRNESNFLSDILKTPRYSVDLIEMDLRKASELDPNWLEPLEYLKKLE